MSLFSPPAFQLFSSYSWSLPVYEKRQRAIRKSLSLDGMLLISSMGHRSMNQHKISDIRNPGNLRVNCGITCNVTISDRMPLFKALYPHGFSVISLPVCSSVWVCLGISVYAGCLPALQDFPSMNKIYSVYLWSPSSLQLPGLL